MVEVDWNSLFASFFGMVRIKIACKDASKIPKKRMFEMRKKLYVIQFKVEGEHELQGGAGGSNDGSDDDDSEKGGGEDPGMEEIDHDMEAYVGLQGGGSKNSKEKGQCSISYSTPADSRKVAEWASLF
jgi:hypothetical protein